jgi:hypothetical protein
MEKQGPALHDVAVFLSDRGVEARELSLLKGGAWSTAYRFVSGNEASLFALESTLRTSSMSSRAKAQHWRPGLSCKRTTTLPRSISPASGSESGTGGPVMPRS